MLPHQASIDGVVGGCKYISITYWVSSEAIAISQWLAEKNQKQTLDSPYHDMIGSTAIELPLIGDH